MLTKRLTSMVAAAGLLVAWSVAPAAAAASTSSWLPEISLSSALQGPVVAAGRLQDPAGRAAVGNIVLFAWPSQATLSRLQPGDHVKLVPVAKAIAGSDGTFSLRIDPTAPIAEFTSAAGIVDFEIEGQSPSGISHFSFPRRLAAGQAWTTLSGAPAASASATVTPVVDDPAVESSGSAPAPLPAETKICTSTLVSVYSPAWDIVGEVYTGPHADAQLVYQQGSTSTVGVGVSVSGTSGTFSASGTSSLTDTGVVTYPNYGPTHNIVEQSEFRSAKYSVVCTVHGTTYDHHYEVRPYDWIGGGTQYVAAGPPTATMCTPVSAGIGETVNSGTAITFTNGYSMSGQIGIDLSTSTGFTTNTELRFNFIANGNLCGSNGYPLNAARIVGK